MATKRRSKPTSDGVEIVARRYLRNNGKLQRLVDKEFQKLQIGMQIQDLRKQAGLTQARLAELVGTTNSAISRLESADYDGYSLKMLERIAVALGKRIDVRIVDSDELTSA